METHRLNFAANERALCEVLDFLPYPFLVAQREKEVWHHVFLNSEFIKTIGYSLREIPTIQEWYQNAYPDENYRTEVQELWSAKVLRAKSIQEPSALLQVQITTKYQGKKWFEVKASVADDNIQMVGFIDINETKSRGERLEKMNDLRDRILSLLGHDLRTPINHLQSLSQMLLSDQISKEEFTKMVTEINDKARRTMEFLSTLLSWAKSNFDEVTARPESLSLSNLIQEISILFAEDLKRKNINIQAKATEGFYVVSDRDILFSALRNIISNAIKFSNTQSTVEVEAEDLGTQWVVKVIDSGVGMEQSKIDQINANRPGSFAGTKGEQGLGIGLLLCKDLLQRRGAQLLLQSKIGEGTVVSISIPKKVL